MVATSPLPTKRQRQAGLALSPRAIAVLVAVYQMRQLTRVQLERLHFGHVAQAPGYWSSSLPGRLLRRLVAEEFLYPRPLPREVLNGRPPLVYALGCAGVPIVAGALGLPLKVVLARQQQDTRLSWLFYAHRAAIAEVRIALTLASCARGYTLSTWIPDEELALLRQSALINGRKLPVRPDGYFVLDTGTSRLPRFLELQLTSEPRAYEQKARAYDSYYAAGQFTQAFGFSSLRVLAVTETAQRAVHLLQVAECMPTPALFWAAALPDLLAAPFGAVWFVGGETGQRSLLG